MEIPPKMKSVPSFLEQLYTQQQVENFGIRKTKMELL